MFIISGTCKVMKITLRFLFFFGTSNCSSISVLKRDPRYIPMGPLRAVTQLRLSAPKMLTQPLKFCTSVTKCRLLLFILFSLSSPPLPASSCTEPPLARLSCLCAWLNRDEDTLRGVGRDEGDPFYLFSWNPRSWVIPCLPNCSAYDSSPVFHFSPSILKPQLLTDYKYFFLDRCCLCL